MRSVTVSPPMCGPSSTPTRLLRSGLPPRPRLSMFAVRPSSPQASRRCATSLPTSPRCSGSRRRNRRSNRLNGVFRMNDSSSAGKSNVSANIAYDDLREWLVRAELLGEVRNVKGASWQEDIGLAAEAILREENGPCVVFDDVPGSPKGFRVLLNMFAGTRRNMTLGFPDHLNKWELSDAYREAYLVDPKLIPHEIVDDGPVLENVLTGDDIDV